MIQETTEFNMAVSYLGRLNAWKYAASECFFNDNMHGWYKALVILHREVKPLMANSNIEKAEELRQIIDNMLSDPTHHKTKPVIKISKQLINTLLEYEDMIMAALKDSGMLMKMAEDATRALR